ncbi:MAG: fused MFS/spermidine synthase [Brachybacterium sp.]|nr:fused MFS/spermidine synthase [Brachybacterium sp.]
MARRRAGRPERSVPFPHLGPTDEPIRIATGTARLLPETDGSVTVEVNGVPSSAQHPDPTHLIFEYMRWMRAAVRATLDAEDHPLHEVEAPAIAHLGGGACSLPRALAAHYPRAQQWVVEIDGLLTEHARTWFDLPRSPALRIRQGDAADVLADWRPDRFDVLIRDVFDQDATPERLRDARAAADAARVLRPGGLYLANCADIPGSGLLADEVMTLRTAFSHVGVIAEPGHLTGRRRGNCVLLASDEPLAAGIDRAVRTDAVTVRLLPTDRVDRIAAGGSVTRRPAEAPEHNDGRGGAIAPPHPVSPGPFTDR